MANKMTMGIKPVEWPDGRPRAGIRMHSQKGLVGYTISCSGDGVYRWASSGQGWSDVCPTLDAAKSAVQADYEARISAEIATPMLEEWDVHRLDRLIAIIGENSAAWRARTERNARRAMGEDVHVWRDIERNLFIVGPVSAQSGETE